MGYITAYRHLILKYFLVHRTQHIRGVKVLKTNFFLNPMYDYMYYSIFSSRFHNSHESIFQFNSFETKNGGEVHRRTSRRHQLYG